MEDDLPPSSFIPRPAMLRSPSDAPSDPTSQTVSRPRTIKEEATDTSVKGPSFRLNGPGRRVLVGGIPSPDNTLAPPEGAVPPPRYQFSGFGFESRGRARRAAWNPPMFWVRGRTGGDDLFSFLGLSRVCAAPPGMSSPSPDRAPPRDAGDALVHSRSARPEFIS